MDSFMLGILLYIFGMVVVITVAILLVSAMIAKKKNVPVFDVERKNSGKVTVLFILYILCIILILFGIVMLISGLATPPAQEIEYGSCYKCDGLGLINKNGIVITCTSCNGTGIGAWKESSINPTAILGVVLIVVGIISAVLCFAQLKKYRKN